MGISVIAAVKRAFARTRLVLFTTFDIRKWLLLAFCAFLAQCDAGGSGFNIGNYIGNLPKPPRMPARVPATMPTTSTATAPATAAASAPASMPGTHISIASPFGGVRTIELLRAWVIWISDNAAIALTVLACMLVVGLGFAALLSWLGARGQFMFIDGIVHNHGSVVEPWQACRRLGNSLFGWSFALNLLSSVVTSAIIVIGVIIAWPDLRDDQFGSRAIIAIIFTAGALLTATLAFALVRMLLHDFVVPAMYLHNLTVRPAWRMVKGEIISGYVGEIVLFYLMGMLLSVITSAIGMVLSCATCCVTALPYVGTVVLLPLLVFKRSYALCFIEQFGPRWTVFFDPMQRCQKCGYDLRYDPGATACPGCGAPVSTSPGGSGFVPPYPPTAPTI